MEPFLCFEEQPALFIRFNGKDKILGRFSTDMKKTYPRVKINNHSGHAKIFLSVYPHKLIGSHLENGVYSIMVGPGNLSATFDQIAVEKTTKKDFAKAQRHQFSQGESRKILDGLNFSKIYLSFTAELFNTQYQSIGKLPAIVSEPIGEKGDPLKICYISQASCCSIGNEEIVIICSLVKKGDIEVIFHQELSKEIVWKAKAIFHATDIYYQHTIVCKTPAYKDQNITSSVKVQLFLHRPSDDQVSDPYEFTYTPFSTHASYPYFPKCKRKKAIPALYETPSCSDTIKISSSKVKIPGVSGPVEPHLLMERYIKQSAEEKAQESPKVHSADKVIETEQKTVNHGIVGFNESESLYEKKQIADLDLLSDKPQLNYGGFPSQRTENANSPLHNQVNYSGITPVDDIYVFLNSPTSNQDAINPDILSFDLEIDGHSKMSKLSIKDSSVAFDHADKTEKVESTVKNPENSHSSILKRSSQSLGRFIILAVETRRTVKLQECIAYIKSRDDAYEILNTCNNHGQNALLIAAICQFETSAQILVKAGADPQLTDNWGFHAVHMSCYHGNHEMLNDLLYSQSFDLNLADTKNNKGLACYHLAVQSGQNVVQCLKLLSNFRFNADVKDGKSGRSALHFAVEDNNIDAVLTLVESCHANINASTYDGYTPLHLAASRDLTEIAIILLMRGANCHATVSNAEDENITPIDLSVSHTMRNILTTFKVSNCSCNNLSINSTGLSLSVEVERKLEEMLSEKSDGPNWCALSKQLGLSNFDVFFRKSKPVYSLVQTYSSLNGTMEDFIEALKKIDRKDVVDMLKTKTSNCPSEIADRHITRTTFKIEML